MRRIAIIVKKDDELSLSVAKKAIEMMKDSAELIADEYSAEKLSLRGEKIEDMECDAILVIGGDGTILRICQNLKNNIPILGINTGEIGFLADLNLDEIKYAVDLLLGDFEVEEKCRISAEVKGQVLPPALNEAVIITERPSKMLRVKVYLNDELLEDFRADGVIVATPTGSTAYSMSAGGPIIHPNVESFVIVPLAPHKLSSRPWVVSSENEIKVVPTRVGKDALLVLDGQYVRGLREGEEVTFTKHPSPARFVKTRYSFSEKVRKKLMNL
jgi:NAD+ kinase